MPALIGRWAAIGLNQVLNLILGLVGIRLISELVPPHTYGVYVLFLTLTQIAPLLVHSPEINHAARFWQREERRQSGYPLFLWQSLWSKGVYLLPILGLCCGVLALWKRDAVWLGLWPVLWIGNVASSAAMVAQNGLNAAERRWTVFFVSLTGQAARIFFPVLLVLVAGAGFFALAIGYSIHAVLGVAMVAILLRRAMASSHITLEQRSSWLAELHGYGRPFILLGIGAWLLQSSDRWIIALFFGNEAAGEFGLAAALAGPVTVLIMGALMQLVFPRAFRAADLAKTREDWRRLARRCDYISFVYLAAGVLGLLLLWYAVPHLMGTLIAHEYQAAARYVLPAGFSIMTASALQFQYLVLQGQGKSLAMVKVMSVVAGLKLLLCGAAALSSISTFIVSLIVMLPLTFVVGRGMIWRIALGASDSLKPQRFRAAEETV